MQRSQTATPIPHLELTGWRMAQCIGVQQNRAAATRLDLASEATLGLLESSRRFDVAHGTRLTTYAYARMRGRAMDAVRGEARYLRACERATELPETHSGPTVSERLDAWRAIERVADELPSNERIVLDAFYRQDKPLREVAQQGRWSEDQLQRAHQKLLQRLRAAVGVQSDGKRPHAGSARADATIGRENV
jgi:RNA polymerase sigma factor (sigma-70 family)